MSLPHNRSKIGRRTKPRLLTRLLELPDELELSVELVVDAALVDVEPIPLCEAVDMLALVLVPSVATGGLLVETLIVVFVLCTVDEVAAANAAVVELPQTTTGSVVAAVVTLPEGVAVPTVA